MSVRQLLIPVVACLLLGFGAVMADEPQPGAAVGEGVVLPRNSGPEAVAHSRTRQYRRKTVRIIRRTPDVMREDAARYRRGDIFSTWSNRYKE